MNYFDIRVNTDASFGEMVSPSQFEVAEGIRAVSDRFGWKASTVTSVGQCNHEAEIASLQAQVVNLQRSADLLREEKKQILYVVRQHIIDDEVDKSDSFVRDMVNFGMDGFTRDVEAMLTITFTVSARVEEVDEDISLDTVADKLLQELSEASIDFGSASVWLGDERVSIDWDEHDSSVDIESCDEA